MSIDRDGSSELGTDELRHEWDAARSADQQDNGDVFGCDLGRAQRPPERPDRVSERWPNHCFELGAGHANLGAQTGQHHGDFGVGLFRQRFFCLDGTRPQLSEPSGHDRVVQVELVECPVEGAVDMGVHRRIKVDAAKAIDTFGLPENLKTVGRTPQDRSVEGAASEVIDRNDLARFDAFVCCVVNSSCLWLGDDIEWRQMF